MNRFSFADKINDSHIKKMNDAQRDEYSSCHDSDTGY
jgi:hypothetical protein